MFSATKFVVAGAIVALFGGFLLVGVMSQPNESESLVGSSAAPEATRWPVQLPAEISDGIDSGTLDTPLGPARWVHLSGDESTLPRQFFMVAPTPDGYIVPELDGTSGRLWRSPDLINWSAEQLGIEALDGELSESGGWYWLNTSQPAGLWRSKDTKTWQQMALDDLAPPGPNGYAWALMPGMPVAHDGVVIVPFQWGADNRLVPRELPGIDAMDVHASYEVEPGVYEFFHYGTGPVATVRFEETEGGVRVIDHEDDAELTVLEGVSLEFIERMSREGIPSINGLGVLDGDKVANAGFVDGMSRAEPLVLTADAAGFASYALGPTGLVHVHRSQNGRDWAESDRIGDTVGEPTGIESVGTWDGRVTLDLATGDTWTTTDGVVWEEHEPPPEGFDTPLASGWIQLPMGMTGNPLTGAEDPDRLWFQPEDGEPAPIDITEMAFPINDGISGPNCGGYEGFISPNTSVSTFTEECDGLREHWIITFDDVPA